MKASLLILGLLCALLLPFGINLPQENPEELFLTDQSLKELEVMKQTFGDQSLVFVSRVPTEKVDELMEKVEFESLAPLLPGHGVMRLPSMGDREKFAFFKDLSQKFPTLTYAGDAYTNAQLAGMSFRIQEILFPLLFVGILIGIFFLTRNVSVSLYLFLSSLLGTGIGLVVTRLLYGHSTILTTLTPLIAFVLTLGTQLHVVYGLSRYKGGQTFHELKIRPILMMMITTVIGFLSLVTSDLTSIRQLALTSSLTLTLTWGILLLLVKFKTPEISLKLTPMFQREWLPPKYRPILGNLILAFLLIGGAAGLMKMPVLVEAIHFFPDSHPIQRGYQDIIKGLGGTPQFDLFVTRKDGAELALADFQTITTFEHKLKSEFPQAKILSLAELAMFANEKYAGTRSLPDNDIPFQFLVGRLPSILRDHLARGATTRVSLVTKLLTVEERGLMEQKLAPLLSTLQPIYEIKLGGLTHLLLRSQAGLVNSLIKSFLLSFAMITLIFAFFSRNLKATAIFAFLNFASVMGGLFLMWALGFTLNVSSVMTVSISMGLVVDSTIHLLHGQRMKESKEAIYETTLVPIILSHILLFVAFGALSLESFIPIRDFSLGLIMLLFVGLLCDVLVLPMVSKES